MKFIKSLVKNRELLIMFINRDIQDKYRGAYAGLAWLVINPLLMLTIYTIVFSQIFQIRWGSSEDIQNPAIFAINLFAGLIVFNMFSESTSRSPTLICSNPNYVKKIRFPIEILGAMTTCTSTFNALIGMTILIVFQLIIHQSISLTLFLLPIVWTPLLLGILGLTWMVSTIGVFFKDISQITNSIITVAMFMSPIFYPKDALPEKLAIVATLNPLVKVIEQTRDVVITNQIPNMGELLISIVIAIAWAEATFRVMKHFQSYMGDQL